MQGLHSGMVDKTDDLFLRMTAVVSTAKPGTVVNTVQDLAKFPRCDLEKWILSALQYSLGFTFSLTTTNSFGELNATTQIWNGMIGSLLNNTADLALSTSVILPFQYNIVDYSIPLGSMPGFMAFYRRQSIAYDSWALTRPFHAYLWLLILTLMVTTSILFACILTSKYSRVDFKSTSGASALYLGCLWSMEVISLRPRCSLNSSISNIILFLTFSSAAFIINAFYNGMLLSFLSIPSEPFKRLDQLMAVPFKFVVDNNLEFLVDDLEKMPATKGFRKAVKEPLKAPRGLISVKTDVLKGSFAFIGFYYRGYIDLRDNFTPIERASIAEIPILTGQPRKHALMLPKGSPHKRLINFELLKTMQCGINKLWKTRLLIRRPDGIETISFAHRPISIVSMTSAAVVLVCGFFVSVIIFGCEIWYVKNRTN